ncbi:MAG: hypothetical protein V4603_14025, partial [Pseudomonadota bacterium]
MSNKLKHLVQRLGLHPLAAAMLMSMAAPTAFADDLQQVFDLAVQNDPEIRGARARYNASHTVISQGRSYLL